MNRKLCKDCLSYICECKIDTGYRRSKSKPKQKNKSSKTCSANTICTAYPQVCSLHPPICPLHPPICPLHPPICPIHSIVNVCKKCVKCNAYPCVCGKTCTKCNYHPCKCQTSHH